MTGKLDFRILGPVRVLNDGAELSLGGRRPRAILALLVANCDRAVSTASIANAVWQDDPPPSVASSIQVAISGLRSALTNAGHHGDRTIVTAAPGYRLAVEAAATDLGRFRALRAQADAERAGGRLTNAADHYRAALAEWSGRAFEDLIDLRYAGDHGVELDEERLSVLQSRIDTDLELGRHRDLVGELAGLTAEQPLQESLWASYMLALYRSGRQADALAAYRTLRRTLDDELGIEPNPALRDLEVAILDQHPRLEWTPASGTASSDRPSAAPDTVQENDEPIARGVLVSGEGLRIEIGRSGVKIGRMHDNTVVLDDPKVSRYHAVISANAAGFLVTDLHSTNGTRVNGELVVGARSLDDGDVIAVAAHTFAFVREHD